MRTATVEVVGGILEPHFCTVADQDSETLKVSLGEWPGGAAAGYGPEG